MEITQKLDVNKIKDSTQSGNVSFLIGSGMSRPYLDTLDSIEKDLTQTEESCCRSNDLIEFSTTSLAHPF